MKRATHDEPEYEDSSGAEVQPSEPSIEHPVRVGRLAGMFNVPILP